MSLSWRDRLAVAVYPDRVVWVRAARGLGTRVVDKGMLACEPTPGAAWRGAVAVLPQVLRQAGAAGARVNVLLSNRLTRYAITPNPDSADGREERDLLVRHTFDCIHGDATKGWEIRLSEATPGSTALASAVDRELLAAVREAVSAAGGHLAAIRPYLMAACNRVGQATSGGQGVFVLAEPERLCLLAWQDGGWSAVQQTHAIPGWQATLAEVAGRFAMNAGFEAACNFRYCMPEMTAGPVAGGELAVPAWPAGLSPTQDHGYAGAMLALD